MKKIFAYAVFALLSGSISLLSTQARPAVKHRNTLFDSIGVEKKDGKRFILHRVDEGQTLFAISRKYKRSVAEIKAANPDMKDAVKYDQVVRIPVPDGALSRKQEKAIDKAIRKQEKEDKKLAKAAEEKADDKKTSDSKPSGKPANAPARESQKNEDPARAGIHVVEPHQTLYSLANRYGVLQADIRRWNNLSGNNVLIGQALIVSEKAYLARTPASQVVPRSPKTTERPAATSPATPSSTPTSTPTAATPPRQTERRASKPSRETRDAEVASRPTAPESQSTANAQPVEEVELPSPGNDAPMPTQGRRMSASGVAEMISSSDGSGKYLALHRTAPIGTLVQVRNEFNNQSLWVKVIGRLPNTGVNDKILIKLSRQAFAKLSPEDKRFRAEVSYIVR